MLRGKVALLMVSGLAIGWTLTLALRRVLSTVVEMHAGHDLLLLASVTAGLALVGILAVSSPRAAPLPSNLFKHCEPNRELVRWSASSER
jgi:hypothetical protein